MSVATKISENCIVYGDESYISPHYDIVLISEDKQIRYYPPYLMASTIWVAGEPKIHVQELSASFVAVLEFDSELCLNDVKKQCHDLVQWVFNKTLFRPSLNLPISYVKQSTLFVPVSTSYYWE